MKSKATPALQARLDDEDDAVLCFDFIISLFYALETVTVRKNNAKQSSIHFWQYQA